MTDGEVAVRQHGQEHAIATSQLDGQILADLDGRSPTVQIPADVDVTYHDTDDDLVADGAGLDRTEVDMRGFALPEDLSRWALGLAGVLLVAAGALLGTGSSATGLAAIVGGAFLGYIGARSAWSERP